MHPIYSAQQKTVSGLEGLRDIPYFPCYFHKCEALHELPLKACKGSKNLVCSVEGDRHKVTPYIELVCH